MVTGFTTHEPEVEFDQQRTHRGWQRVVMHMPAPKLSPVVRETGVAARVAIAKFLLATASGLAVEYGDPVLARSLHSLWLVIARRHQVDPETRAPQTTAALEELEAITKVKS